ncbi:thermonuclease family protein [Thalassospira sp. MCCC 1A03138]|uniref:thermonuclease family protein n=1 Tax=Thalassospira sp. MCCC 1A03138 TaxID=1470576 RepID=UPI000A1DD100|nr:thermonuclease family protein [Thalassospira sp. MCCC 1A03138]OSQ28244.1 nuclease [Thalassospira sp. MCCC 1A03138]
MPFCISIASPLSNHQTIEVTLNRFFRLIILLAIPVACALAVYLQDKPVHAAGDNQQSDQMALKAEGRDVLVIDGDTIMIDGVVADIAGIDAPELGQQCLHNGSFWDCGMSSAMQLRKYFAMAPFTVRCWPGDQEHSGKDDDFPIVECGIGERDVAAAMVSDGEALPIEGYSHRYDGLSEEADNAGIGIQGGDMIPPSEWRSGKRLDGERGRCLFAPVGNEHYVGTLDPRYENLIADKAKLLCSDEQARKQNLSYAPIEK